MTTWCIPWWHEQIAAWAADSRPVTECPAAGASTEFPLAGFVPCKPDELRAAAEKNLHLLRVWPTDRKLPLIAYSLARMLASDSGANPPGGPVAPPEEFIVIGETVLNESTRRRMDPSLLLLGNKATMPFYGTADQGRFAPTDKDPSVGHVLIAMFLLSGQSDGFARGATAYLRPDEIGDDTRLIPFLGQKFASNAWGWTGPFPWIPTRRLMALVPTQDPSLDQITLNQQALTDLQNGTNPAPPTEMCPGPGARKPIDWKRVGGVAVVAAIGAALAAGTGYAVSETNVKRWKEWEPPERPQPEPEPEPPPPEGASGS